MTFSKGIGRVIDLALIDKDQFDVSEAAAAVKDVFPLLELPLYMVNEIIPKLMERKALRRDEKTPTQ